MVFMKIINEVDSVDNLKLTWRDHDSARFGKIPEKLDKLLENLSKQTSLEFVRDKRKVDIWFITG